MTFRFRLQLIWTYVLGFITNRDPVYIRYNEETYIRLARWKYDPWTDTKTLIVKHGHSTHALSPNGKLDDYNSMKWRYVSKSKNTLQKLQNS